MPADLPLLEAVGFLFMVAMLRANATYWIGRGVLGGVRRSSLAHRVEGPTWQRAEQMVARWGVLAVPLSFLTIGVQTAVNAMAGMGRMPLRRYLPAVAAGALIWAVVYATVGLAAIYAAIALALRSPLTLAVLAVVAVAGVVLVRRRGGALASDEGVEREPAPRDA